MTREPVAHAVSVTTRMIVHTDRDGMYAARMIISGIPGSTSARLVMKLRTLSRMPGR